MAHDQTIMETGIRPKEWSRQELTTVKGFIQNHNATRSPAQKLKTQLLSIKYKLEEIEYNSNSMI